MRCGVSTVNDHHRFFLPRHHILPGSHHSGMTGYQEYKDQQHDPHQYFRLSIHHIPPIHFVQTILQYSKCAAKKEPLPQISPQPVPDINEIRRESISSPPHPAQTSLFLRYPVIVPLRI